MIKTDKIKFDISALIYLILVSPRLQKEFKNEGFNFEKRLMTIHAESGNVNFKAKTALRKIFNTFILNNGLAYKKRYLKLLVELEKRKKEQTNEFSIEIKGAGSKAKVIHDLREIVSSIEASTLKELRNEVTWENEALLAITNLPQKYY